MVDLAENSIYSKFLTKEEWIIADCGFNGQIKQHILSFNYFKNTEDEKVFLKYRSVVENAIAKIKKWQICSLKFQKNLKDIDITMDCDKMVRNVLNR